ncbi:hypothetical protein Tco_1164109 [Tanacetum coccineum]
MVYQLTKFHVQRVDMVINPPWNLPFLGAKGLTSPEQTATDSKRLNDRKLQIQECKIQELKAMDASSGEIDNSRFVSDKGNAHNLENDCSKRRNVQSLENQSNTSGNESSRSGNECSERSNYGDDTDIRPSYEVDSNTITDSLYMCNNEFHADQNTDDNEYERVALANLIANLKLDHEWKLQELKTIDASSGEIDSSGFVSNKGNAHNSKNDCSKTGNVQSSENQSITFRNESSRLMCNNEFQANQNVDDNEDERVVLANLIANLKLYHDQNKKIVEMVEGGCHTKKLTVAQKDTDISLLDSRATYLKYALDDSKAACAEVGSLITSLTSERDRLTSEVSTLHTAFQDFKEKVEAQQEEQSQVIYNRVAELEAHVMDVSSRLKGEFYPAYLTTLAGRRWFLTHGIQFVMLKCFKSPEYQGILGHALGRAVDFGMQEGLEAGHEHGLPGTRLSAVVEFLDCFILDGPLADLPEAAHLQPCLEQLSVPIHHSDDKAIIGETSLSFALPNVHSRAEGAKKHAAALRQLMLEIVFNPLSSQTWVGETSTSTAPLSVEDFDEVDTDKALGSVVAIPKFEACRF